MKKLRLIPLMLCLFMLIGGCTSPSADKTIELGTLQEAEELRAELEKELVRLTESETLAMDYKDGVYFGDYDEIKKKLNKQAEVKIGEIVGKVIDVPHVVKVDVILYNSGFKEAKEKDFDFEMIATERSELLKYVDVQVFAFIEGVEDEDKSWEFLFDNGPPVEKEIYKYIEINDMSDIKVFDLSLLKAMSLDEMKAYESGLTLFNHLRSMKEGKVYGANGKMYQWLHVYGEYGINGMVDHLNEKYNNEFVFLGNTRDEVEGVDTTVLAPKWDLSLKFRNLRKIKDRFRSVLSQKLISERINKVIDEEGVRGFITQFSAADLTDDAPLDVKKVLEDPDGFLNNFPNTADISLYYLKTSEEEIDYNSIIKTMSKSQKALGDKLITSCFVFIYEVSESDRDVLVELFREAATSEYYFRDTVGMHSWAKNRYVVRNDSDCFKYLEVFGELKESYHMDGDVEIDMSKEVFIDVYKIED